MKESSWYGKFSCKLEFLFGLFDSFGFDSLVVIESIIILNIIIYLMIINVYNNLIIFYSSSIL